MLDFSFKFQVTFHLSCHLSATLWELSKKIGHVNAAHLHVRTECRVRTRQTEGKIATGSPAMSFDTEVSKEHLFGQYSQCDLTFVVRIDPKRTESALKSPSATREEAGPVNASKSTCFS